MSQSLLYHEGVSPRIVTFVWRFALVFVVQGLGQLAPELLQLAAGPPAHPAHRLRHPAVVEVGGVTLEK
jgi:hypothetical protein